MGLPWEGRYGDHVRIESEGEGVEKKDPIIMECPTKLMEAEVSVDIILSFNWLVEFNVDLQGRRYGFQTNTTPCTSYQGWKTLGPESREWRVYAW